MLSGFDAGDTSKNNGYDNNSENFWHKVEKKWLSFWDDNKTNISDVEYSKKKFFSFTEKPKSIVEDLQHLVGGAAVHYFGDFGTYAICFCQLEQ